MRALGIWRTRLQVAILAGCFDCIVRLLPQIKLTSSDKDLPYILENTQFPVHLCFAMTVNKSQGQSVDQIGVNLHTPAFTHRQLYMALSRVTFLEGLILLLFEQSPIETDNVVYPEVLL